MKKATLFAMALLMFAAVSFSQDTAYQKAPINLKYSTPDLAVWDQYPNGNGLEVTAGQIAISGDTLKVIKQMVKELEILWAAKNSLDERVWYLTELMNLSVKFLNNVPDHWKRKENNNAWPQYRAALIKQGWKVPIK